MRQPERSPVFYNNQGLRSGWRIVVYLFLTLVLYGIEFVPASFLPRPQNGFKVSTIMLGEAMFFVAAYGAALLMARIEALPSGEQFETVVLEKGNKLRARGEVARFYREANVRAGDYVLLTEIAPRRWTLKKAPPGEYGLSRLVRDFA